MPDGIQVAVQIVGTDVARLDELVAQGRFASRAEALREGLAALLQGESRRRIGEAIADGYRRHPQTEEDEVAAEAKLRQLIAEEPW